MNEMHMFIEIAGVLTNIYYTSPEKTVLTTLLQDAYFWNNKGSIQEKKMCSQLIGLPRWCYWLRTHLPMQKTWVRVDPWVGKIPWRRTWQPSPVFLPGRLQFMGLQRVGQDWLSAHTHSRPQEIFVGQKDCLTLLLLEEAWQTVYSFGS